MPTIGPPPTIADTSFVNSDGTSIAIAFKSDEITTTSPEAKDLFFKGLTYSTQYARYNDSLEFFDKALALDQNFTAAWVAKGVALHNMKRYDEAINCYDEAFEINPEDAGIWSVKCITLRDSGKSAGVGECNPMAGEQNPGYQNVTGVTITQVQTQSCGSLQPPVPAGGDVWIGESNRWRRSIATSQGRTASQQ